MIIEKLNKLMKKPAFVQLLLFTSSKLTITHNIYNSKFATALR